MFSALRKLVSGRATEPAAPLPPSAWKRDGNAALARGALDEAAAHYLQGTVPPPGDPLAWLNLAYVQLELGRRPAARESLAKAETMLPRADEALRDVWCLQGRERGEEQDWPAARDLFARVVAAQPSHELAWRELARAHDQLGNSDEAADCFHRALALRADFVEALEDLVQLEFKRERHEEALRLADRLVAMRPDSAQSHFARARPLWKLERQEEALAAANAGLAYGDDAVAIYFRGIFLAELERHEEALADFERALAINPGYVDALASSAPSLRKLGRDPEGVRLIDRALELDPHHVNAMVIKGVLLHEQNRCHEALQIFDQAIAIHGPDRALLLKRAYACFSIGRLEEGFRDYESRWGERAQGKLNKRPEFGVPHWSGEPLEGRSIYIFPEQGLGDSIQFMRYIPLVAAMARQVYFSLPNPIVPLTARFPANCRLLGKEEAIPSLDFACSMLSLPMAMGTSLQTIPAEVPYVDVDPALIDKWRRRLGPKTGPRVGLVWSGNVTYSADQHRSIPLEMLRAVAPPDVQFVSLQKEIRESDREAASTWPGFILTGDEQGSFADAAALACLMDVVITVDTSVGHMTGALGRPWWVLLAFSADWRWMVEREDSPWYPSVRLFRQPGPRQWQPVIDRVMAEVALLPRHDAPE